MPELSRFYGIVVRMYFDDHAPPHFHAAYGADEVVIDIRQQFAPRSRGRSRHCLNL